MAGDGIDPFHCTGYSIDQPSLLALSLSSDGWSLQVQTNQPEGIHGAVIGIDRASMDSQVGVMGATATAYLDPSAIKAIAKADSLSVEIEGEVQNFHLVGSAAVITKIQECVDRNGAATDAAASPEFDDPEMAMVESDATRMGQDCPALGDVRSYPSDVATTITFANRSDRALSVYWLDFDGIPQEYAGTLPGESVTLETYSGHMWIAKDFDGTCAGGGALAAGTDPVTYDLF